MQSILPSRGVWGHAPPGKFLKIRCFKGGNFSHTMVIIAKNVHWKINTMKINTIIMYNIAERTIAYVPSVIPLEF